MILLPLLLLACGPRPEPLDLPADPAARGVPVGVTRLTHAGLDMEVFYPASDATEGPDDTVPLAELMSGDVRELLGDVDLPDLQIQAVRDAPLRVPELPYPVLLFSHGFGGFGVQSATLTGHLASRGYVVIAPEHVGRRLADVLGCLFSPPLESCYLAGFGEDPAIDDLPVAFELAGSWAEDSLGDSFFGGAVDTGRAGLLGHSAGAVSTANLASTDPSFKAVFPMAGNAAVTRDVPAVIVGGACDATMPVGDTKASWKSSNNADYLEIEAAGHLAFTDLCALELGALADEVLLGRDDINSFMLGNLRSLAVDGCPGYVPPVGCADEFLPIDQGFEILEGASTVFFDEVL